MNNALIQTSQFSSNSVEREWVLFSGLVPFGAGNLQFSDNESDLPSDNQNSVQVGAVSQLLSFGNSHVSERIPVDACSAPSSSTHDMSSSQTLENTKRLETDMVGTANVSLNNAGETQSQVLKPFSGSGVEDNAPTNKETNSHPSLHNTDSKRSCKHFDCINKGIVFSKLCEWR